MNKYLIVIALVIAAVAAAPTETETKTVEDSFAKALKAIDDAKNFLKTEYIEDFSGIIKKGCQKLHVSSIRIFSSFSQNLNFFSLVFRTKQSKNWPQKPTNTSALKRSIMP